MKRETTKLIPVYRFRWDIHSPDENETINHYECSKCNYRCEFTDNYCGGCGRKIQTEEN